MSTKWEGPIPEPYTGTYVENPYTVELFIMPRIAEKEVDAVYRTRHRRLRRKRIKVADGRIERTLDGFVVNGTMTRTLDGLYDPSIAYADTVVHHADGTAVAVKQFVAQGTTIQNAVNKLRQGDDWWVYLTQTETVVKRAAEQIIGSALYRDGHVVSAS
jgi:hypothetical protein